MQLRRQHRVHGVGRPKFDFHTGAEWFVSQAVYDPAPTIRLLRDYGDACREAGLTPCKVVLTFAPCGRAKTMTRVSG